MSETAATPTPSDASATQTPSENGSSPLTPASPEGTNATPLETRRKRKRKRKRKAGGNQTAATPDMSGSPTPPTEAATGNKLGATSAAGQGGGRGKAREQGVHHKKKRSGEVPRKHRRDGERPLRTQEQLASWRWHPTSAQLAYFPLVTSGVEAHSDASSKTEHQTGSATTPGDETLRETLATDEAPSPVVISEEPASPDESAALGESAALETTEVPPLHRETVVTSSQTSTSPKWGVPQGTQLEAWITQALAQCPQAERPSLLVTLCSHRGFRQRVNQLSDVLQKELRPLAAVYDAVFLDTAPTVASAEGTNEHEAPTVMDAREDLRRGLEAVCHGSVDILRSWPLPARERLNELAEDFELDSALYKEAPRLFFDAPKLVGRAGLRAICDALSQGQDSTARDLIKTVGSQPGVPGLLPMLTEALEGQRFGSLVILTYGGAQSRGPDPKAPKRHSGFCLESQRDVWIRTGESQEASAFEHYSQVHRRALLPGVVGLYAFGVTRSRKPYAAVLRKGISLQRRIGHSWGLQRQLAVSLATDLTLLASGLCRAGLRLPDLDARRFELDEEGKVWLSDVWGAELMEPRAQDPQAITVCRDAVVQLLANQPGFLLPGDWREVLSHSADFETIVATLRKLEKSRFWRG